MSNRTTPLKHDLRAAFEPRERAAAPIRRRTDREFLGLPLVDVAIGADPARGEPCGQSRGIVAIGDRAVGLVAIGVHARGAVAIGITAVGAVSIGWLAGGIVAVGGIGIGLASLAAVAVGVVAMGGVAVGTVAVGLAAAGEYAAGFAAIGEHVYTRTVHDPAALRAIGDALPGLGR